ncbi:MAG: polyprenyl synthetase family protein [Helicobacteraceae bacterium]|nr:polyprenyl synthetase family protein [Helicobacteraceae bacterium]
MKQLALHFNNFENYLKQSAPTLSGFHPYLQTAFWEMVLNGGKRFRPQLLLSIVYTYAPKKIHKAFNVALALEVLHTYSLIHDDLPAMDNASLRRGCETLHKKYDEAGAILVGDALNTHAFYLISQAKLKNKIKIKAIKSLSKNAGIKGMVLGQALDCYFENQTLPLEKLKIIHLNKTAKLISCSLELGGIIAECDKKTLKSLKKLGLNLGLFFQIRDDIIDATKSEKEAGKPTNNDSAKNSYVNLLGLDGAKSEAQKLKKEIFKNLKSLKAKDILESLLKNYFIF